jgi:putative Ca2+/H+ antiporter (TMEM165/GDT1 family)
LQKAIGNRYHLSHELIKGVESMDFKVMLTTFGMIFIAELGDKTQLATFCFAAGNQSKLAVFLGSAGALVLTSGLGCLLGSFVSRVVPANYLNIGAGVLFVILGGWMIFFPSGR